jgi:hypothetical protein
MPSTPKKKCRSKCYSEQKPKASLFRIYEDDEGFLVEPRRHRSMDGSCVVELGSEDDNEEEECAGLSSVSKDLFGAGNRSSSSPDLANLSIANNTSFSLNSSLQLSPNALISTESHLRRKRTFADLSDGDISMNDESRSESLDERQEMAATSADHMMSDEDEGAPVAPAFEWSAAQPVLFAGGSAFSSCKDDAEAAAMPPPAAPFHPPRYRFADENAHPNVMMQPRHQQRFDDDVHLFKRRKMY